MGGLHVRVDGDGAVKAQLVLGVQGADHHLAELGPGELAVGPEISVGKAVHHAHKPQGFHLGVSVAAQVVEAVGRGRGLGGQDQ